MKLGKAALGTVMALSLFLSSGCQSATQPVKWNSNGAQSSTREKAEYLDYNLSQKISYQGVTISSDPDWEINDSKDYEFDLNIDMPDHSHITIRSALYGQTATLDDAWAAYTAANSSPITEESWEADGVTYNTGYYSDGYFLFSGCEKASGKGFLLWLAFNDNWTHEQAEELFNKLTSSLSYDPSQTTLDYTDAYKADNATESDSPSSSNDPSSTSQRYGEGMYKVGADIPAGEYKLTATSDYGYWEVTTSSSADADIIGNDNFSNSTYVTVSEGQYLKLSRCYAEPAQ